VDFKSKHGNKVKMPTRIARFATELQNQTRNRFELNDLAFTNHSREGF